MNQNGQIITLPGIIATLYSPEDKEDSKKKKIFLNLSNILSARDCEGGFTEVSLNEPICLDNKSRITHTTVVRVEEPVYRLFSAKEHAKYSVEFGEEFIRKMRDAIKTMQQLGGV